MEGRDAIDARFKKRERKSNITQIFTDTVEITGTAAAVANYGISDMYTYEQSKKQLEPRVAIGESVDQRYQIRKR